VTTQERATTHNDELPVGRIAGVFGVRGELKCDPTSAGRIVFSDGARLQCRGTLVDGIVELESVREHKGRLLLRIAGVDDPNAAQRYVDATFFAPRDALDVGAGEYLDVDLIGCAVEGIDGRAYGPVERVEHYPASDMLVVRGRLVPMVRAIVTAIDMPNRRIVVDPPIGLLDGEAEQA
jgi:16S rRNA processing protein RimM